MTNPNIRSVSLERLLPGIDGWISTLESRIVNSLNAISQFLCEVPELLEPFRPVREIAKRYPDHFECLIAASLLDGGEQQDLNEWASNHGIPQSHADLNALTLSLWEGKWYRSDKPLDFIRSESKRLRRIAKCPAGVHPNKRTCSLDSMSPVGVPIAALLPQEAAICPRNYADHLPVETFLKLKEAWERAELPSEDFEIVYPLAGGDSWEKARVRLGWSKTRVARLKKEVIRARPTLRLAL